MTAQCAVLRCTNEPSQVVTYDTGGFPAEFAVCAAHHARIEGGEEWTWDLDSGAVLMGPDLKTAGERLVTKYNGFESRVGLPTDSVMLELEYADGTPLNLLVSKELLHKLRTDDVLGLVSKPSDD